MPINSHPYIRTDIHINMHIYIQIQVVMDECMEEISWAIAFAAIGHKENAGSCVYRHGAWEVGCRLQVAGCRVYINLHAVIMCNTHEQPFPCPSTLHAEP